MDDVRKRMLESEMSRLFYSVEFRVIQRTVMAEASLGKQADMDGLINTLLGEFKKRLQLEIENARKIYPVT